MSATKARKLLGKTISRFVQEIIQDCVQTLAAEILHRFDCSSKNKPFCAAGVGMSCATIAGP